MLQKKYFYIVIAFLGLASCHKIIDLNPISNIGTENYYKNNDQVQVALTGCYNGLMAPLRLEWMLTELRSDNAKQGVPTSSSTKNLDYNALNMYEPGTTLPELYDYWNMVYTNIRSINYVLRSVGVKYENGSITVGKGTADLLPAQRDKAAGEALFLRAYHYFNLVRIYGGVFLITEPISPQQAEQLNRSEVTDIYNLIIADLSESTKLLSRTAYGNIPASDRGRATTWAAEALLAKVYLTINRKSDALALLNDVINNSGYDLVSDFGSIFSTTNEMNKEILFAVRFRSGGVGLGNFMPNDFAPVGSGSNVVNGDGAGLNYPTFDIDSAYKPGDNRYNITIGKYQTKLYPKKFVVPVVTSGEGENDFPILRFSDVLLMKAEATGFDGAGGTSVGIINRIRERSGAATFAGGDFNAGFYKYPTDQAQTGAITNDAVFLTALLTERRLELAFENQRLFDLIRTGRAISGIQSYFAREYAAHYSKYTPTIPLSKLQSNVNQDHLILPIPQREIDANTTLTIPQNPGY